MSDNSPDDILKLNYFVYGDDPMKGSRRISISRANEVDELERALRARYNEQTGKIIRDIILFKIDISEDQLPQLPDLELPSKSEYLRRDYPVSEYWPAESKIVASKVHVLVRASVLEQPALPGPPSDDKLAGYMKALSIRQEKTKNTIQNGASASMISKASNFRAQQEDKHGVPTPIHNGRPRLKTGLPVELYHPVFSDFTRSTQCSKTLDPSDLRTIEGLLFDAQALYKAEDDRTARMYHHLEQILDVSITKQTIKKCTANGVIRSHHLGSMKQSKGYCVVVEVKNEIGTGDCDPSIRGAESYGHYWHGSFSRGILLSLLHRCYRWSLVVYPWCCYQATSFRYIQCLAINPVRPVFLAQVESGDLIAVKFVRQYSKEGYQILMGQGLAPELLYDSETPLDCGMRMIVMRHVLAGNLADFLDEHPKDQRGAAVESIYADVEKALQLLHANDLVFGDLRPPNILVVERETGIGAMLVDFDWCSKAREGRYPLGLNDSMINTWATGMKRGGPMEKTHDTKMLERLLERLFE